MEQGTGARHAGFLTTVGRRLATVGLVVVTVGDWVIVGAGWLSASYLAGVLLWSELWPGPVDDGVDATH